MQPSILSCYEGLGQNTTGFVLSLFVITAVCSSHCKTEAFVSKDHSEVTEAVWDHILN